MNKKSVENIDFRNSVIVIAIKEYKKQHWKLISWGHFNEIEYYNAMIRFKLQTLDPIFYKALGPK